MKNLVVLAAFASLSLCAQEPVVSQGPAVEELVEQAAPAQIAVDAAKISEAFGHLIGKNLESIGFKFDIAQVIKGLQDASLGKEAPMTEMECVQAITAVQESVFKQQVVDNLQKANDFLAKNTEEAGVISLEPGKLQYKVLQEGSGVVVQEHFTPLIRYKGAFMDGTVFGASKEEELISLDETLPGFTKGVIGMKEGEKRELFIHPDLGYGTTGYLPPNSLLTFEVEVLKANAAPNEAADTLPNAQEKINPEVAAPTDTVTTTR